MGTKIIPYDGIGKYKLLSNEADIINLLKQDGLTYNKEIWDNSECTVKTPWTIIRVENYTSFFFANNKLFKIYINGVFDGELPNGITIGMNLDKAQSLDSSLKYDDWNEDWSSDAGYWLEDDIDTNNVLSITIFIKELLDDDIFEKYEW